MRFAGRDVSVIAALLIVMAVLCSDSREMCYVKEDEG